jgi:hypothetical protein
MSQGLKKAVFIDWDEEAFLRKAERTELMERA